MKKNILILSCIFFLFAIISCLGIYVSNVDVSKKVISNDNDKHIFNSNSVTMMYETEADSGEYQVSSDNSWPQDGYVFNEILSKCENGSKLTWDNENKKIVMQANSSDRCYVYFDKELVKILYANLQTDSDCTGMTGLTDVQLNSNKIVKSYYINVNNTGYQTISIEPFNYDCTFGSLCLNYYETYSFALYAEFEDKTKSDIYESNYTPTCFVAETKVLTIDGYKNIEDIKVGDKIYSYNEITNKNEIDKVSKFYIHNDNIIYILKIGHEIIKVTPTHIVYAKSKYDKKGNWIAVKNLTTEHYLYSFDNNWKKIDSINIKNENNIVYNIEVEKNHTYYVTKSNYLVHNAKATQYCP